MTYEEAKKYANEWTTSPEFARWFLKLDAIVNCPNCDGTGGESSLEDSATGYYIHTEPCPTCTPLRTSLKTKNGGE